MTHLGVSYVKCKGKDYFWIEQGLYDFFFDIRYFNVFGLQKYSEVRVFFIYRLSYSIFIVYLSYIYPIFKIRSNIGSSSNITQNEI